MLALKNFDLIFLHSKNDAARAVLNSPKLKFSTMGVEGNNLGISFKRKTHNSKIFFVGNLDYMPNFLGGEGVIFIKIKNINKVM